MIPMSRSGSIVTSRNRRKLDRSPTGVTRRDGRAVQRRPASMRLLIVAALLFLGTAGGRVFAEPAAPKHLPASAPPSESISAKRDHEAAVCVGMWDHGTHMTKQQWLHACRRVQNRLQQLQIQ